jgi:two-component system, NtrC family, sensor kinase
MLKKIISLFKATAIPQPTATEEIFKSLALILGVDQLLENFSAKVMEALQAFGLAISLYEPITGRYLGRHARGGQIGLAAEFCFPGSDKLIKWLGVNQQPLDILRDRQIFSYLEETTQKLLDRNRIVLVVPFIVINRLSGLLLLAAKKDGAPYSEMEKQWLTTVTRQSGLAIEHSLMYQQQQDELGRLFQADKLATVGELAAGVAHEISNPLTAIRSTLQFVQDEVPETRRPLMTGLLDEVDRIDRIVKGLLSFSKSAQIRVAQTDVIEILEQTLLLLDSQFRKSNVHVKTFYALQHPVIIADAGQLKQVLLNIILNGLQACASDGEIAIHLFAEQPQQADEQRIIHIQIRDNGCGIAEWQMEKIFHPFYTTKENGTGLGLSISYGIISRHGGAIHIDSKTVGAERGTCVEIVLPAGNC